MKTNSSNTRTGGDLNVTSLFQDTTPLIKQINLSQLNEVVNVLSTMKNKIEQLEATLCLQASEHKHVTISLDKVSSTKKGRIQKLNHTTDGFYFSGNY